MSDGNGRRQSRGASAALVMLGLLACSTAKPKPAITCEQFGDRVIELAKTDEELKSLATDPDKAASVKGHFVDECTTEHWTQEELGCVMAAKDIDGMTACKVRKRVHN
jgi:hypothetical protein